MKLTLRDDILIWKDANKEDDWTFGISTRTGCLMTLGHIWDVAFVHLFGQKERDAVRKYITNKPKLLSEMLK